MSRLRPLTVVTALLLALITAGCASTPAVTREGAEEPQVDFDATAPRVFLAGAEPHQARSVAMGAAASKGWTFVQSRPNLLVMQRPLLRSAAAAAGAPGPAQVEVRTGFFPKPGGTEVALEADLLYADAKGAVRIPYTDRYRAELERSLASLRRSWETADWRIAGAAPPLPDPAPPAPLDTEEAEPAPAPVPVAAPVAAGRATLPAQPTPAAIPAAAPPASSRPAASSPSRPAPVTDSMLTLNTARATGVWAYYAEQYARVRGCTLAGEGAVLQVKTPEYEDHQVSCEGGQTFLVRCNAGVCQGLK